MFTRAVIFAAVVMIGLLSNQSIVRAAPTPSSESIVALNRQLQSMVFPPAAPRAVHPLVPFDATRLQGLTSRTAVRQPKSDWLSSPTFLLIASRFASAERILHYRRAGFDANFWGVLSSNRSIRVKFFVRL